MAEEQNKLWVASNRVDDRVVIYERDPLHPGGEVFVAGKTPDHAHRTPAIQRLLQQGLLVEVPEPPDEIEIDGEMRKNPYKPLLTPSAFEAEVADAPGGPTRLNRDLSQHPELYPEPAQKKVEKDRERREIPAEIPSQAIVPPAPVSEKDTARK